VKVAGLIYCLMSIVGLVAAFTIRSIYDGDNNIVSISEKYQELYSYPVGTTNWWVEFRFTTRKIVILGTYIDVYKATALSWLIMGHCNTNYSRWHFFI
jgi:hypothetical protein